MKKPTIKKKEKSKKIPRLVRKLRFFEFFFVWRKNGEKKNCFKKICGNKQSLIML